ncbi:MAG: hypothetical protein IJE25_07580 [Clostridia bacterium]|nr:hypothetical protein [Clostridia bacterium]
MLEQIGLDENSFLEYIDYLNSDENKNLKRYAMNNITFGDDYLSYWSLDDVFEIWASEGERENRITYSYNSGKIDTIENLEEENVFENQYCRIFKLNIKDVSYPIYADFPRLCIPEIKPEERYKAALSAICQWIEVYKTYSEFEEKYEELVGTVKSCSIYDEGETYAYINFSGHVKKSEKLMNSFTKNVFYKLTVSSDEYEYIAYASENDVPEDLKIGDIVCIGARMTARFEFEIPENNIISWKFSDGAERYYSEIAPLMFKLKPIFFDFLIVEFDKEEMVDNIEFIQTKVDNYDKKLLIEVKKVIDGVKYLYAIQDIELHVGMKIFYDLLVNRKSPDVSLWEDISDEIFENRSVDDGETNGD